MYSFVKNPLRDGESGFIFESDEQRRDDTKGVPIYGEAAKAAKKLQRDDDDDDGDDAGCSLCCFQRAPLYPPRVAQS